MNDIDIKTIRKILRKGNFKGHTETCNFRFDYFIYGVRRNPYGEYLFNIKIKNYDVKSYGSKTGIGWLSYKDSDIPGNMSMVRHYNWLIRSEICIFWESFMCGTFKISPWRFNIGLIKHI